MHEDLPEHVELGGPYAMRPLDPARDSETIHAWTRLPYSRFWAMGDAELEDIRAIYTWLWESPTHHAYLVLHDASPVAVFQTYRPEADEVGEHYDAQPGDLGAHFMLGPRENAGGTVADGRHTTALLGLLLRATVAATGARRIIAEPDVRNTAAIARLVASGFTLGPIIRLSLAGKDAQLAWATIGDIEASLAGD